eukprot:5557503-Prymnesium_polylepis.1
MRCHGASLASPPLVFLVTLAVGPRRPGVRIACVCVCIQRPPKSCDTAACRSPHAGRTGSQPHGSSREARQHLLVSHISCMVAWWRCGVRALRMRRTIMCHILTHAGGTGSAVAERD